jgi:hypothetical protein
MILKRYDELKKGDKIWFHGHKAFVRDVKETGIVTDKNNVYHFGERIFALNIGFEPSPDGIEKTAYNSNAFNYGGVASCTVAIRE